MAKQDTPFIAVPAPAPLVPLPWSREGMAKQAAAQASTVARVAPDYSIIFGNKPVGYALATPPAAPKALAKISLGDLRRIHIAAPLFVVTDLVPSREVTLLPADGGTGKSQLMLQLAVCMALGRPFMGKHCVRSKVVYYSAEDDEPVLLYRLKRICDHMDLGPHEMLELGNWLHVSDVSENPSLFCEVTDRAMGRMFIATATYDSLLATVKGARGEGIQRVSVIVDNASDTFDANENARQEVRKFIRLLKALARQCDGAVVREQLRHRALRRPHGHRGTGRLP